MERELGRFTLGTETTTSNLRRVTVCIGGARDLRVRSDGRIHPDGGAVAGAPVRLKPYVSLFVVGKSGRRIEAAGLAYDSHPPKSHLSAVDSSPVWNETFELALSAETLAQASALVLVLMDSGQRGLFGASAALLGARIDVPLAQARMEWIELSTANMVERETELPLLDEAGRRTGAVLTVRTEYIDLVACRRELVNLDSRLRQVAASVEGLLVQRRGSDARVAREGSILENEMEFDAHQAASAQAAAIMREMQMQLVSFVEAEEIMCADAAHTVDAGIANAATTLTEACESTSTVLSLERTFYPEHVPQLHSKISGLVKGASDAVIVFAQQANLRHAYIANDSMADDLELCEVRLHQATDYQIILQREASERARAVSLCWLALPAKMARGEVAQRIAVWAMRQQGLRAESLAAAAALHSTLVDNKLIHDEESGTMRLRQQRGMMTLERMEAGFVSEQHGSIAEEKGANEVALHAFHEWTAELAKAAKAEGGERIVAARDELTHAERVVAQVEAATRMEAQVCKVHFVGEATSRLDLLGAVLSRRLERICRWIVQTEEQGRQVQPSVTDQEQVACAGDAQMTDGLGVISLVEARSRDLFEYTRLEHTANVAVMHAEMMPVLELQHKQHDMEMCAMRADFTELSVAAVGGHIKTVERKMADVVNIAVGLRMCSRQRQAEAGAQLLVLHLEHLEHASETSRVRLSQAYKQAWHSIRLQHAHIGTTIEVALLRERNTQHLAYNRIFTASADTSWARERAQLLLQTASFMSARVVGVEQFLALAEAQAFLHYEALTSQSHTGAESETAEMLQSIEAVAKTAAIHEGEPARAHMAQRKSHAHVLVTVSALLDADEQSMRIRRREAGDAAIVRIQAEANSAAVLIEDAQTLWHQQVGAGIEADVAIHHTMLVESERATHAAAMQCCNAHIARMAALAARSAAVLDSSSERARFAELQREQEWRTVADGAQRMCRMLTAGHEVLHHAFEATRVRVHAAVSSGTELVLQCQHILDVAMNRAAVANTLYIERTTRAGRQTSLVAFDDASSTQHVLARLRDTGLRAQEAAVAGQLHPQAELGGHVAQVRVSAREQHERAAVAEQDALRDLAASWAMEDGHMQANTQLDAVEWQARTSDRLLSKLSAAWRRQRVHHAHLCREMQSARRRAFTARRAKRHAAGVALEQMFLLERTKAEVAMAAIQRHLADECACTPQVVRTVTQQALDRLCRTKLRDMSKRLQACYAAAAAIETERVASLERLLSRGADSLAMLLAELTSSSAHVHGPTADQFVREVVSHALGGDDISNATAWTLHWESEEAAALCDLLEQITVEGVFERQQRTRKAAWETTSRAVARIEDHWAQHEEAELTLMREEEVHLMGATAEDLQAVAGKRAMHCELEWDMRAILARVATSTRHATDASTHSRTIALEAERQHALGALAHGGNLTDGAGAASGGDGYGTMTEASVLLGALMARVAAVAVKVSLQRMELDEALEAQLAFEHTLSDGRTWHDAEIERVVGETLRQQQVKLEQEVERTRAQLLDHVDELSTSQLLSGTKRLLKRMSNVDEQDVLSRCCEQVRALGRPSIQPHKLLNTDGSAYTQLSVARLRLQQELAEAQSRIVA